MQDGSDSPTWDVARLGAALFFGASALLASCASPGGPPLRAAVAPPPCEVSPRDLAWLDRALAASRDVARRQRITYDLSRTEIFAFDASCLITISPEGTRSMTAHRGKVPLPIGDVPAAITSFAAPSSTPGAAFFAMSLPSIWEASGFRSEIPVEDFTLGVLAHEISHVQQFTTYLQSIRRIPGVERLPAPVNDDIVQRLFAADSTFSAGVRSDIAGFLEASKAPDIDEVRRRARVARDAMRTRWARHYTGDRAALAPAQEVFLTLEGSGQWFALQALTVSPSGPRLSRDVAMRAFAGRGGRWSQDLGLAIALVLDRVDASWPQRVYGAGDVSMLELLDRALRSS